MHPIPLILGTRWTRQGEWGGSTLSRTLTYAGMQRTLADWTGIDEGYESFLHSGETTYIATGQYERFARAMLVKLQRERNPLVAFTARFDKLLADVTAFLDDIQTRPRDECLSRYFHLHQHMQPYSYVFGYGEDQVVGELLTHLLRDAELAPAAIAATRHAATAPAADTAATSHLRRLRQEGADSRALDFADLVRRQLQVRTDRRVLWNRVEQAMQPVLLGHAERAGIPPRLVVEATPRELLEELPPRAALEARIGGTFFAHNGGVHLLGGEPHALVQAHLRQPVVETRGALLQGQGAYPGVVRGRVRIVMTREQGDALERGEVLVSDMTTPDLTLACSRAAAMVTDRGGILCHAALVAREMRIPCVLGTEDATRVLRDGDLVEVDAMQGIVRLLAEARP